MPRSVEADGIAFLGDERVNENFCSHFRGQRYTESCGHDLLGPVNVAQQIGPRPSEQRCAIISHLSEIGLVGRL